MKFWSHFWSHFFFSEQHAKLYVETKKQNKRLLRKAFLRVLLNVQNPIAPLAAMRSGVRSP